MCPYCIEHVKSLLLNVEARSVMAHFCSEGVYLDAPSFDFQCNNFSSQTWNPISRFCYKFLYYCLGCIFIDLVENRTMDTRLIHASQVIFEHGFTQDTEQNYELVLAREQVELCIGILLIKTTIIIWRVWNVTKNLLPFQFFFDKRSFDPALILSRVTLGLPVFTMLGTEELSQIAKPLSFPL